MVLLLIAAAAVSLVLGDLLEAVAIGVVIILNAALGFVIELRARRAMESLLQLQAARASTLRDGHLVVVPAETLVPGDVTELTAGQTVPADGRVIVSHDLRTNEAALTGESLPVGKVATADLPNGHAPGRPHHDGLQGHDGGVGQRAHGDHRHGLLDGGRTDRRAHGLDPRRANTAGSPVGRYWAGASSGSRSVWLRLLPDSGSSRGRPSG